MGELPAMIDRFKNSIVLMGIDWSRAAKRKLLKILSVNHQELQVLLMNWIDSIARRTRLSW